MNQPSPAAASPPAKPRVAAVVGLTLLEVIRRQDVPTDVFDSEDPSVTMPRRLGLSDVIDRQIRTYREEVRKGRRITDEQVTDLVRLVIRRPDSEEVFYRAGRALASRDRGRGEDGSGPSSLWRRLLPRGLSFALARRAVRRRLQNLFGRRVGGFAGGPFNLEARAHVLIQSDPGGDACVFVTGLAETVVQAWAGDEMRVAHPRCQAHGDTICQWSVLAEERTAEREPSGGLALNPEPEAG